jgi:Arc/MetJ-type ribon-helix-helix transcriptional regulator
LIKASQRGLAASLGSHDVTEARKLKWERISNGELLKLAEETGFDLLLTTDKNVRYQQNLADLKVSIVMFYHSIDITLPADLRAQIDQELASGHDQSPDDLIGQAIRHFLDERRRGQRRLDALRSISQAVDQAGLYERVLIPGQALF